jgi:enolase-phosphatase E1
MVSAQVILLDIEGTTTPVDYVFGVLFPYAVIHSSSFLQQHIHDPAVQIDLELLRQEYISDRHRDPNAIERIDLPNWDLDPVPYIHFLINSDRKSKGLKSLQGKIWRQGYESGELRSQIFADVPIALQTWQNLGKRIYIYSSGSVNAQKLLFQYSEIGDLTKYLSGYFDTAIGNKRESSSYAKIAKELEIAADQILFISDVVAELEAANQVGMETRFSIRPGNHSNDAQGFKQITSFSQIV